MSSRPTEFFNNINFNAAFYKKTTDSEINIRGSTTQNIIDIHNQELILKDKPSEVVVTETTELFFENIILEYPILGKFQNKVINLDGDKMIGMFATSYKPIEEQGHKLNFYAQLGIYFVDGFYGLHIILRDLNDMRQENWEVKTYEVEDIKEAYQIIDSFMMACDKLNIIKPDDKFSIRRN